MLNIFEEGLLLLLTGSIDVTVDTVQELMVAADMLQLSEVVDICGEFLRAHMDPSNCVGIYRFLEQIACMELLKFTEDYIHCHFLEVGLLTRVFCFKYSQHFVLSSLFLFTLIQRFKPETEKRGFL